MTACIAYATPTDYAYYYTCPNKASSCSSPTYPVIGVPNSLPIVASVTQSDGNGGSYVNDYRYSSEQVDLNGRGFLGFGWFQEYDPQTSISDSKTIDQTFPMVGLIDSETVTGTSFTYRSITNTYNPNPLPTVKPGNRYTVSLAESVETDTDLNGQPMGSTDTSYAYDGYGNPITVTTLVTDPRVSNSPLNATVYQTVTNNLYFNDIYSSSSNSSNWMLGRLACSQSVASVISNGSAVAGTTVKRTTDYLYYLNTGLLAGKIIEPDTTLQSGNEAYAAFNQSANIDRTNSALCQGSGSPYELTTAYARDGYGNVTSITQTPTDPGDTTNRTTTITWSGSGDSGDSYHRFPFTVTDAVGEVSTYQFDPGSGQLTSATDPNNLKTAYAYDPLERLSLVTAPTGTQTTYTYGYCLGFTSLTSLPNIWAGRCPLPPNAPTSPTNATYAIVKTPLGAPPTSGPTPQTGPITVAFFDSLNRQVTSDVQAFDLSGCAGASDCYSRTQTVYYGSADVGTAGLDRLTIPSYFIGQIRQVSTPAFSGTVGKSQTAYSPAGWTVYNNYDQFGRPLVIVKPDGSEETRSYSGLETVVKAYPDTSLTNPRVSTTWRNRPGKPVETGDSYNNYTTYTYDGAGDLLTQTDPILATATFWYDVLGRVIKKQDLNGNVWQTPAYDSYGDLLTAITPNENAAGTQTTMTYDPLGRVIGRSEPDMTSSWTYFLPGASGYGVCIGQQATATAKGTATVSGGYYRMAFYDSGSDCRPATVAVSLGQPVTLSGGQPQCGTGGTECFSPSFDATTGELNQLTYPDSTYETMLYNNAGYLYQTNEYVYQSNAWSTADYYHVTTKDAWLHTTLVNRGNDIQTAFGYDINGRLSSIVSEALSGTSSEWGSLQSISYLYDSMGNLTNRVDNLNEVSEAFDYDLLNEMTSDTLSNISTNAFNSNKTWSYVTTANRPDGTYRLAAGPTLSNTVAVSAGAYTYSTSAPYQVSQISGGSVAGTFSYDTDGNTLIDAGGRCYNWTSFDMPAGSAATSSSCPTGGGVNNGGAGYSGIYFAYDPEHRRIQQGAVGVICPPSPPCRIQSYPAVNYYWMGKAFAEQVLSNNTWRDHVIGPDGLAGILSNIGYAGNSGSYVFFRTLPDYQGSVSVVTNGSTDTTGTAPAPESDCYDSWGKRRYCSGADDAAGALTAGGETTRGYIGQEMLDSVGLVHLNARLYDPVLGRFISQDPIGLAGGLNPYAYTRNNPTSRTDSGGLADSCPQAGAAQVVCVYADRPPWGYYGSFSEWAWTVDIALWDGYPDWRNDYAGITAGAGILINLGSLNYSYSAPGSNTPTRTGVGATALTAISSIDESLNQGAADNGPNVTLPQITTPQEFGPCTEDCVATLSAVVLGDDGLAEVMIKQPGAALDIYHGPGQDAFTNQFVEGYGATVAAGIELGAGAVIAGESSLTGMSRFFYDSRAFRTISRQYWRANGPANGSSLAHWLFPQSATWVPLGIRNAGFNLIELPPIISTPFGGLNQWMGMSNSLWAPIADWAIRIGIPASFVAAGYAGATMGGNSSSNTGP